MMVRAFLIGLLIAGLEIVQGVLRVRLLSRPLGDHRARQVGVLTGSALVLIVAWVFLPWIGAATRNELFAVGTLWFVLMMSMDLGFGRLVFGMSWKRIAREFDVRRGGLLGFGMLAVFLAPVVASWIRH